MQIILLSGGSGKRLWPLSNDARSKQFLPLLTAPDGSYESMVQRISRQIEESGLKAEITIATSVTQYDSILNQLGKSVDVVTEPERRDTFPAIALSASYLLKSKGCDKEEVVLVMPSDSYVDAEYFKTIAKMVDVAQTSNFEMVLMGVAPTEPSTKFGYIVPQKGEGEGDSLTVERFTEKPNEERAKELLAQNAFWNGGVFTFKLGYIAKIIEKYIEADSFEQVRERYSELPKISFDYEVVERAKSIAMVPYSGAWSDLGTWSSLAEKLDSSTIGSAIVDKVKNTHVVNELEIPIVCLGTENLIVAASPDGILVSNKEDSINLKSYADSFSARPMYEERRWGKYKVMGREHFEDGHNALTKLLCIDEGCNISYQFHNNREEIWTIIDGRGVVILDGEHIDISRGSVVHIKVGQKHAVKATTPLTIIEVQTGGELVEEDIIRLEWEW